MCVAIARAESVCAVQSGAMDGMDLEYGANALSVITVTDIALPGKTTFVIAATTRCPPRATLHQSQKL